MSIQTLRSIYQLKITLKGSKPPIWRRLLVPSTITLPELHNVFQVTMGWTDTHLHQFVVGKKCYGEPDPDFEDSLIDEAEVRANQLLKKEKDILMYEYDFGDGWEHKVELEKVLPFEKGIPLPKCLKGKRGCPPEDVGGVWGYQEFLKAFQDPAHPEHDEMREWAGEYFDPENFSVLEVNELLSEYCQ